MDPKPNYKNIADQLAAELAQDFAGTPDHAAVESGTMEELPGTDIFQQTTASDIQDAIASLDAAVQIEMVTRGDPRRLDWLTALAGLEAQVANGKPLSDFDVEYKKSLMEALTEGKKTEQVYVQEMLLKKVGPEKYRRISRRFVDHQKELEVLEKINKELNAEIEQRERLRGPPIKGPMVVNQNIDPGMWLIEVDRPGHIASSFRVTAKPDGTFNLPLPVRGTDNAALRKLSPAEQVAELANQKAPKPRTGFLGFIAKLLGL